MNLPIVDKLFSIKVSTPEAEKIDQRTPLYSQIKSDLLKISDKDKYPASSLTSAFHQDFKDHTYNARFDRVEEGFELTELVWTNPQGVQNMLSFQENGKIEYRIEKDPRNLVHRIEEFEGEYVDPGKVKRFVLSKDPIGVSELTRIAEDIREITPQESQTSAA